MKIKKQQVLIPVIKNLAVIMVALAAGGAVGTGFVAFIAVLGIIPRLVQLTKTVHLLIFYEWATILGVLCGSWLGSYGFPLHLHPYLLGLIGLFYGVFVGMLAAALYEVLNVFPIIARRINMEGRLRSLMTAIIFGKIFGSIYYWVIFF